MQENISEVDLLNMGRKNGRKAVKLAPCSPACKLKASLDSRSLLAYVETPTMLPRPELLHQSTLSQENLPESGKGVISGRLSFFGIYDHTHTPHQFQLRGLQVQISWTPASSTPLVGFVSLDAQGNTHRRYHWSIPDTESVRATVADESRSGDEKGLAGDPKWVYYKVLN